MVVAALLLSLKNVTISRLQDVFFCVYLNNIYILQLQINQCL